MNDTVDSPISTSAVRAARSAARTHLSRPRRGAAGQPCRDLCCFRALQLFMSDTRLQEAIALEETADGLWSIDCCDVLLARPDARNLTRSV